MAVDVATLHSSYIGQDNSKTVTKRHAPHRLDNSTKEILPHALYDGNQIDQATLALAMMQKEEICDWWALSYDADDDDLVVT